VFGNADEHKQTNRQRTDRQARKKAFFSLNAAREANKGYISTQSSCRKKKEERGHSNREMYKRDLPVEQVS